MGQEAKQRGRAPRYRREEGKTGSTRGKGTTGRKTDWYIWRVAPEDELLTRADHLRLAGHIFHWDDPPIHNTKTGARGHPGMDGPCRCYAEPVEKPSEAMRKYADKNLD